MYSPKIVKSIIFVAGIALAYMVLQYALETAINYELKSREACKECEEAKQNFSPQEQYRRLKVDVPEREEVDNA